MPQVTTKRWKQTLADSVCPEQNVDRSVDNKKGPELMLRATDLVAGAGFEPTTSGL
jgi:hypothetical protein